MRILLLVAVAASALAPLTKRLGTPGRFVVVRSLTPTHAMTASTLGLL